jgi:predicted DNA-binding protein with PD1-like motif
MAQNRRRGEAADAADSLCACNGLLHHASRVEPIGAFSAVTLGYFDRARRDYRRIALAEQVEVLALLGDVALDGAEPTVHAHVVVGLSDGTTRGGHLLEGRVWPTLELVLTETPGALRRRRDPETGLALLDPDALGRGEAA